MRPKGRALCGAGLAALLCASAPALAQEAPGAAMPDPATIEVPDLAFTPDDEDVRNFEKYFFFHRSDADYETALADLRECDGYARGFAFRIQTDPAVLMAQYGVLAGGIGGALGDAMADAIFGSAERRRMRRINMRTCMTFKGYSTFGLRKSIWSQFNFEEGNRVVPEEERLRYLMMQARVASGPRPSVGEMSGNEDAGDLAGTGTGQGDEE